MPELTFAEMRALLDAQGVVRASGTNQWLNDLKAEAQNYDLDAGLPPALLMKSLITTLGLPTEPPMPAQAHSTPSSGVSSSLPCPQLSYTDAVMIHQALHNPANPSVALTTSFGEVQIITKSHEPKRQAKVFFHGIGVAKFMCQNKSK